jgi:hypothetical protein
MSSANPEEKTQPMPVVSMDEKFTQAVACLAEFIGITDLLERIATALEGQLELQRKAFAVQSSPEASAAHQNAVARAAEKFFDPDRQGAQMAAVQIAAQKAMMDYQSKHPIRAQFEMPPQRRS